MNDSSLNERDRAAIWHPATHFSDLESLPPVPITAAEGCWLRAEDGSRIFDAISSWWTCVHGHGHPAIAKAIADQAAQLDHVMFAGCTHAPAIELAEALLREAPEGYGKVFFSDCGSASIEVAIKLSRQARIQSGQAQRRRIVALERSYHGETLGALALCGSETYRLPFASMLMDVDYLPAPQFLDHEHSALASDLGAMSPQAEATIAYLDEHADELTAIIIEPLVQCAGSMSMHGAGYYRRVTQFAQSKGIHVIADEIAVAFGRTGPVFASSWAGVRPDLLCCSKGLSGGVLPLACTLIRAGFEDAFRGSPERTFMHSHTFTGNPIACAAGLANLALFRSAEMARARNELITSLQVHGRRVAETAPTIAHFRQAGTIVAFDLCGRDGGPAAADIPQRRLSLAIRKAALARGVLIRPLHDTLYWMPPLVATDAEIAHLADTTLEVLDEVLGSATAMKTTPADPSA